MSDPDLFISYSREDRARAHIFADRLAEEGFSVWWDAALHSGETFDEVIERNLRAAKAVVVLWSPRSVSSRWVRAEATLADRRGCLAPVIIEPCDRPIIFELTHTAELSHWNGEVDDRAWLQFTNDLRRLVGDRKPISPTAKSEPQPAVAKSDAVSPAPTENDNVVTIDSSAFPRFAAQNDGDADGDFEQTQFSTYAEPVLAEEHVLELEENGESIASFVVGPLGLRIGRSKPADVVLADPRVSRAHCEVRLREGELLVSDLDSTNGTFIDDQRVEGSGALPVGSVLQVGSIRLVHEYRAHAGTAR